MPDQTGHTAKTVQFTEWAPEIRNEWVLISRVAGYLICVLIVFFMLASLTRFFPELFGTAFGDGTVSTQELWFSGILLIAIATCGAFLRTLIAPFGGRVEVRISGRNDEVAIFHDGRFTEKVKLSDVHNVETGISEWVDEFLAGNVPPDPAWMPARLFFPGSTTESYIRRLAVTENVYLIVGNAQHRVEVASFMAHGGQGLQGAAQAAQTIEQALRDAQTAETAGH